MGLPTDNRPVSGNKSNLGPGYKGVNPYDPNPDPISNIGPNGGPGYQTPNPYADPPPPAAPPPAAPPPTAPPPTSGVLSDPGPYETWAAGHAGDFNDPSATETLYGAHGGDLINQRSASEDLYSQGIGQLDPYYDYAEKMATRQINDAAAAHGGFSRAALDQIANTSANLRGQQARDMASRAQAADAAKLGRYGAAFDEAGGADKGKLDRYGAAASLYDKWQQDEENRLGGALTGQAGISNGEAGAIEKFYSNLQEAGKYDAEGINAALQAAGIDPNSAFGKDIVSTFQVIAKAYTKGA